ncbi:iron ABC transporter permease [Brevibacterium sp. 50QC2O2]|uniref:iron ABC transporter permease n=1 Tax=Brevibacterium sp. 50QC2O2 TaxID=2968459 RepID=UPI00211C3B44|nr:iron ABC transporter permease [Brevibacterium sp. 50QC2O2]MCQ9387127.1 iron ABC transporter permease [Brevibacterium sp. 50QC2O2]
MQRNGARPAGPERAATDREGGAAQAEAPARGIAPEQGGAPERVGAARAAGGIVLLVVLAVAVAATGLWHLTQGTSGLGAVDLVRGLFGARVEVGGVGADEIFSGSRLPRLAAGVLVGFALGVAGCLLQSITRNQLASPDTLAVTAGAYFVLTLVAAFVITVPLLASSGVAFVGGLLAAALVLGITGRTSGTGTTRLILAGSAIAMALDAGTAMLLILFKENTTGLFAWGSGSLGQLNIDASLRAVPLIVVVLVVALLFARRLDVLGLGEDSAAGLGVPVRSTRIVAILAAVLLAAVSVTLAGPIAFVGLGAPVLARLLAVKIRALNRHIFLIPAAGLLGSLVILLADAVLRGILGAEGATSIPTGIPTSLLGGIVIVVLALRMRDASAAGSSAEAAPAGRPARSGSRSMRGGARPGARLWGRGRASAARSGPARARRVFTAAVIVAAVLLVACVLIALLAGSLWLKLGDVSLWIQGRAPGLIDYALDDRAARIAAAVLAGAALGLSGTVVQGTVRNPLAEPGLLGITAGAGLGAVFVVTTGFLGGGQGAMVLMAVLAGLATFALITLLAWRGGLLPDRFVLVGIGTGYALSALTTYLLLSNDPWQTPRIMTWLSGTTYGRTLADVWPVAIVLVLAIPLLAGLRRDLDLMSVDEDTPRILGIRPQATRLTLLAIAAVLAGVAVVAVGTVGFVGLVAPHLARSLVGARHGRIIPVSMLLGGLLVLVADTLGRTLIAPSQLPAGLMIALVGAPYFVHLMRRMRG